MCITWAEQPLVEALEPELRGGRERPLGARLPDRVGDELVGDTSGCMIIAVQLQADLSGLDEARGIAAPTTVPRAASPRSRSAPGLA